METKRHIIVVEYTSAWPDMFTAEAERLRDTLASVLIAIHHIGSTSIPGLAAKPVIDMLAVVRSLSELDACHDAMAALGYEPMGEFGIAGRRFFAKGGEAHRTHHIHAFEPGHSEIEACLDFRDYLRAHPDQARRYAGLKVKLAEQHRHDIDAYIAGKAALVKELLDKARQWRS